MTIPEFAGLVSLPTIIAGLTAWLGGIQAGRIARKEQADLNERLGRVEAGLVPASHISKAQYEREFEIYRDLWDKLIDASGVVVSVTALRDQTLPKEADHSIKQREIITKVAGELASTVERNRPFYAEAVYASIAPLTLIGTQAMIHQQMGTSPLEYLRWLKEALPGLESAKQAVLDSIRSRMREISAV